jgi:hypothetical protein
MVLPLVGIAAGVAARAVAKKVASNAVKKAATKKAIKEAAKKKPLATPKSAVKVKPAAKPVGNPRNDVKALESYYSSISRGGAGAGPAGKARDARVTMSKKSPGGTERAAALRAAKNKALANSAKGKTQTPTAEAARRRNLNK